MKKITNIALFSVYILLNAVFLSLDFSISESFVVFRNLLVLSIFFSLFLVTIRMLFEILIIKIADQFSHQFFSLGNILQIAMSSLFIPIIILFLSIAFQYIVLKKESPYFQIIIFSFSEFVYIGFLLYKLNKVKFSKGINISIGIYLLFYFSYQIFSFLGGFK